MNIKKEWTFAGKSDVGIIRTENEDNFKIISTENDLFLIIADGMGGHYGGSIASNLAVEISEEKFIEHKNKNTKELFNIKETIDCANKKIVKYSEEENFGQKMGTTMLLFYARKKNNTWKVYWNSIGDSSLYEISEKKITKLSKDHSLVQKLIDMGEIKKKDAKDFPYKNVLYRSLGSEHLKLDETQKDYPNSKKTYLLCSDGLTTHVEDFEIQKIVSENKDNLNQCAKELIDLSKERGGTDNITIILANLDNHNNNILSQKNEQQNAWLLIMYIFFYLLILSAIFFIFS